MCPVEDIEGIEDNSRKKIVFVVLIFMVILLVGIFFRTYHFRQWLQFSPDQARDASIISEAIQGKKPLPLLGPQAGNTRFRVGPLYYETQYLSAKFFGDTPEAMAYPDLFFSILAIGMLFVFLRKYFETWTCLFLSGIMSISYFAIEISRFASNPNSIPFFSLLFLYALSEIMQKKSSRKALFWYVILGFSAGVGIQLHTILVFTMPLMMGFIFIRLWKDKEISWKGVILMVVFFLIMNVGQVFYEIRTGGSNSLALFKSVTSRSDQGGALAGDFKTITTCQAESGVFFLSSVQSNQRCGRIFNFPEVFTSMSGQSVLKNIKTLGILFSSVIFLIGGYMILLKTYFAEKDKSRKNFLGLLAVYNFITILVLIPVAGEVETRYFVVLMMVPFVLLGLWIDLLKKNEVIGKLTIVVLSLILIVSNLQVDRNYFLKYAKGEMSDKKISILGEIQPVADYISTNRSLSSKNVVFYGSKNYRKRFYKPLGYLLKKKGINLEQKKVNFVSDGEYAFYVSAKSGENRATKDSGYPGLKLIDVQRFQNIAIYKLTK